MRKSVLKPLRIGLRAFSAAIPQSSNALLFLVILLQMALLGSLYSNQIVLRDQVQSLKAKYERTGQPAGKAADDQPPVGVAGNPQDLLPVDSQDHILGDAKAPLTMTVYSDLECPFCKQYHPAVVQAAKTYKGKVRFVFRHLPLDFHADAKAKAEATECVALAGGNDRFWSFVEAVFNEASPDGDAVALDRIPQLVRAGGTDITSYAACMADHAQLAKVERDIESATKLKIDGTPGTVALRPDGTFNLYMGSMSATQLSKVIKQELALLNVK